MFDQPTLSLALTLPLLLAVLGLTVWYLHHRARRQSARALRENTDQLALLRQLLGSLQRHRGLSTGLLSGDERLRSELTEVRAEIDRYFATSQTLTSRQPDSWQGLTDHWSRLRSADNIDVANNLVQHNQIIRNSIYLIEDIALERDLSQGRPELSYLPWIWRDVIQAAEWAGQARAMGTGMAAAEDSAPGQRVRMRFLHQKIEQLSSDAFDALTDRSVSEGDIGKQVIQCQASVQTFLRCIDQDLLSDSKPRIDAPAFFQQATVAVEALLDMVDTAVAHLESVQKHF